MSDRRLVAACRELVSGDDVLAAGVFQPRGTQAWMLVPFAGLFAARLAAKNAELPRFAVVAVTREEILLFSAESASFGWKPVRLLARYPRAGTEISVEPGVQVRKLTLRPAGGAQAVALESPRLGDWHGKGVLTALTSA